MLDVRDGDLLDHVSPFYFIGHQCNCRSKTPKHLSKYVFTKFPNANVYKPGYPRVPGDIAIIGQVVNMFAQDRPGKAYGPPNGESYSQRRDWMRQCLDKVYAQANIRTFCLPYGIGCGMAGDVWEGGMEEIMEEFTERMKQDNGRKVIFYKI